MYNLVQTEFFWWGEELLSMYTLASVTSWLDFWVIRSNKKLPKAYFLSKYDKKIQNRPKEIV